MRLGRASEEAVNEPERGRPEREEAVASRAVGADEREEPVRRGEAGGVGEVRNESAEERDGKRGRERREPARQPVDDEARAVRRAELSAREDGRAARGKMEEALVRMARPLQRLDGARAVHGGEATHGADCADAADRREPGRAPDPREGGRGAERPVERERADVQIEDGDHPLRPPRRLSLSSTRAYDARVERVHERGEGRANSARGGRAGRQASATTGKSLSSPAALSTSVDATRALKPASLPPKTYSPRER